MTVLPVVARELRVAARRPWTYWGRVVAGGIAVAMAGWMLLADRWLGFGRQGTPLFFTIATLAFGFTLLGGLLYSADCVSSEKRDGTLGLLFLTDLRGWDVALGKLAATSLGGLYGLLAVMPLMALPLLMGGVLIGDYVRMVVLLVTTLFCSLAAGLLASVLTKDVRRSVFLTFLLLVVIVAIVPMAYETIAWFGDRSARRAGWFGAVVGSLKLDWLRKLTPFESFGQVQGLNYAKGPWSYWSGVIYTGAVGLGGLAYASWRLPRVWQDRGLKGRRAGVFGWVERWWFSGAKGQQQFRTRWLDENPVAWLSGRYWTRRWLVWIFLIGSLTGIWLVGDWVNNGTNNRDWWLEAEVLMLVAFGLHLALKFWVANEAPRQFIDDRQSGALELLLSTPLTVDEILRGRWLALWRQFGGPVLAVLILDVLWIWLILGSRWRTSGEGEEFSLWLAAMVILVADLWALSWDGLWIGLTSKGRAATSWMLTRILVLPWIAWFGFLTGIAAAELRMSESVTGGVLLFVWFILAFVNSLAWGLRARHLLRTSFREMATTKRDTRRGWWRRNPKATSASA